MLLNFIFLPQVPTSACVGWRGGCVASRITRSAAASAASPTSSSASSEDYVLAPSTAVLPARVVAHVYKL